MKPQLPRLSLDKPSGGFAETPSLSGLSVFSSSLAAPLGPWPSQMTCTQTSILGFDSGNPDLKQSGKWIPASWKFQNQRQMWPGPLPPTYMPAYQVSANRASGLQQACRQLSSFPGFAVTQVVMFSLHAQTCSNWLYTRAHSYIPGLDSECTFP